jgi:predicted RNase H-like nuclease
MRYIARMSTAAGADVVKGRWVVVVLLGGRFERALVVDRLRDLGSRLGGPDLLALDIPIGLPPDGAGWPRPTDLAARVFVGPRRSSVFLAPPRPVYDEASYGAANALHHRLTGKGLSRQTWALGSKILEAEHFITDHPNTIEAHPEVCLRAMKGASLDFAKKTWNGQMERRDLLAAQGIELPARLDGPAGSVPPDDLLDAAAAAWTAWRCASDQADVLSESDSEPSIGERGVIWY